MEHSTVKITLSIEEACQRIGICRSRLYQEIREGQLDVVKVGRRTLIPVQNLQNWLQKKQAGGQ